MKRILLTACAAALLGSSAFATTPRTMPAGHDWTEAQLRRVMPGLTAPEFRRLDSNGDHVVSRNELEAAALRAPSEDQPLAALRGLDISKLPAGTEWNRATLDHYVPGMTAALFKRLDSDHNHAVSRNELEAAMEDLG